MDMCNKSLYTAHFDSAAEVMDVCECSNQLERPQTLCDCSNWLSERRRKETDACFGIASSVAPTTGPPIGLHNLALALIL